jgi:adenine-specific DNA-methyltransferase
MSDQPEHLDLRSQDITEDRRQELLRLFPEVRTEGGKLDFDRLKAVLGEAVDGGRERYGLTWPGKAQCLKTIQAPSIATLRPCRDESVDFDHTENVIIEGDNLEVLKLLQKAYLAQVKMIYIDPPFNTGNDFIYPDDYSESLQTYLAYTGQADAEGKKFGTNTDTDGRFHSKWLSMMYPRLYLARDLLRNDGVLFVSIDDHEIDNLRRLCGEIFGEESIIGTIVWRRRQVPDNRNLNNFSTDHEYVLVVARGGSALTGQAKDLTKYSNPDNDPRGPWMSDNLTGLANAQERPNLHYDLVDPATGRHYPPLPSRGWCFEKQRMVRLIDDGRILWPSNPDGRPRLKRFLNDIRSQFTGFSSIQDPGFTTDGTRELEELFGEKIIAFPKPTKLITLLLSQAVGATSGDIILDFFAGSGTTGHAVLELNEQDGGNRKFVLVQLPEPTERTDFPTIAEITKERVRRVAKRLNDNASKQLDLQGNRQQDRGFRVFKLAESNFKPWNADVGDDSVALAQQLELHVDHVRENRTTDDLLYETLLKAGFALTAPVESVVLAGKAVYSVAGGALLVCLERALTLELVRAIADMRPERVVCLDQGFAGSDQLKANAVQIFKTKGVTSFKTV